MAKKIKGISLIAVLAAIGFSFLYVFTGAGLFLTLAITFGTVAYHFCMRLIVGMLFHVKMRNKADYAKKWYRVSALEQKLHQKMHIKKWEGKMPTYDVDAFDASKHGWEEIIQAMCQAELVHETNMIFSFLFVIASIWFGAFAVFLITSVLSAGFDFLFVCIQRYNRQRILRRKRRCFSRPLP